MLRVQLIEGEQCDKCKSAEGELIRLETTGRSYYDRNCIFIHERCLMKAVGKAKKESAERIPLEVK